MPREFAIQIDDPTPDENGCVLGSIRLDSFRERFAVTLGYWNADRYRQEWRRSLERLMAEAPAVALMSWMAPPLDRANRRAWLLYRQGDRVYVQDHLFLATEAAPTFDEQEQLRDPPARVTITEEGLPISEWETDITAIRGFLVRRV